MPDPSSLPDRLRRFLEAEADRVPPPGLADRLRRVGPQRRRVPHLREWTAVLAVSVVFVATLAGARLLAHDPSPPSGATRPALTPPATIASSSSTAPPLLPPDGSNVLGAQLVDKTHGWALVDMATLQGCCPSSNPQRLEWTADAGSTWSEITPPGSQQAPLIGVQFRDATEGWVVMADQPSLPPMIAHTTDSGRHWSSRRFPSGHAVVGNYASAAIAFSDADHGWVVVDEGSTSNTFNGIGYRTVDGGRSWTALSVPAPGVPYFATPTDGWMLRALAPGAGFYVTHDGATTWQAASVPLPPGYASDLVSYGPLGAGPGVAGAPIVEAAFSDPATGSVVGTGFYQSHDLGRSWSLIGTYRVPAPAGNIDAAAILSDTTWYLSPRAVGQPGIVATTSGGTAWSTRASPAPSGTAVIALTFGDPEAGWALVNFSGCRAFKADCYSTTLLYGTEDGAQTWKQLHL